jgi:hypothetical protein
MKLWSVKFFLLVLLCLPSSLAFGKDVPGIRTILADLIAKIPSRAGTVLTVSEFIRYVSPMNKSDREKAILAQFLGGNLPEFLKNLKAVELISQLAGMKTSVATVFVMPDYLAIGSDHDFLSIPMDLYTATSIAVKFGFILPTKRIVDAIYNQSAFHLKPVPMEAGPRMTSTGYYVEHDEKIKRQRQTLACPLDALIAGNKKDLVLTDRLTRNPGKVAIYGWHRPSGIPIQPLTTVHGATYADYSHGIRLISETMLIDGELKSVYSVLEDPKLASVLSDEGPIRDARQLMNLQPH